MKLRTALDCLFPCEQMLICAFHTFHFPQAFLTCLVFLTLVDWQRNGFWQNNTEVTDWFEKKHSVPAGGIRLFRSCSMTLHPRGPCPLQTQPLPLSSLLSLPDFSPSTFQQRLIRLKTTPSESWVMLSVDPTFPKQAISSAFSSNHLFTLLSLIHVTPQIPSAVLPIACHSAPIQL